MRPFRKERVASVVRQVVGEAVVHGLHDPRIASLTSVTRVEMTGDLQIARVYLSVHGDEAAERPSDDGRNDGTTPRRCRGYRGYKSQSRETAVAVETRM